MMSRTLRREAIGLVETKSVNDCRNVTQFEAEARQTFHEEVCYHHESIEISSR